MVLPRSGPEAAGKMPGSALVPYGTHVSQVSLVQQRAASMSQWEMCLKARNPSSFGESQHLSSAVLRAAG